MKTIKSVKTYKPQVTGTVILIPQIQFNRFRISPLLAPLQINLNGRLNCELRQ